MEYLLVMSLSGSMMIGIYLLLKWLLKDKVSARLYYLLIKESVLFFLIPLPFLKGWYRQVIRTVMPMGQMNSVRIPVSFTKYVVHAGEKSYVNSYTFIQAIIMTAWLFIVCIIMMWTLFKYLRIRRLVIPYKGGGITEKQKIFLEELKDQYGVRRPVILCQGQDGDHTMTFGAFRPVIICDREIGSWEAEIHVQYEMVHIKRFDVLWKMLARLTVILHWWNPIAWLLWRDFERVCEFSCDEIVMQGKTREEVKECLRLLIDEACAASETKTASIGWQNGFANDVDMMKERMSNLMKKKKWNRYAAGVLVAVLAFANSMTVFAYRDTLYQEVSENASQDEVMKSLQMDTFTFTPDGADGSELKGDVPSQVTEIIYDRQFVDAEENIYPFSDEETVATYRGCSHDFVSGTATEHTKKSNGGCEVREYRAQRCSKCGTVVRGERIGVYIYDVCPH